MHGHKESYKDLNLLLQNVSICNLNLKIPTAYENTNRISENTHRIYLKMAKCRLTRLAWSVVVG